VGGYKVREEKIENIDVIAQAPTPASSTLNQSKARTERMNYISASDFLTIFFYCFSVFVYSKRKEKTFATEFPSVMVLDYN
jgi:hypothetical protein